MCRLRSTFTRNDPNDIYRKNSHVPVSHTGRVVGDNHQYGPGVERVSSLSLPTALCLILIPYRGGGGAVTK